MTNSLKNLRFLRSFAMVIVASFLMAAVAPKAHAQSLKLGFVDLQQALNSVDEGKQAKAKLKKDFDKKQKDLNKQQDDLRRLKEEAERGMMMLSDEAKRVKAMEFQGKLAQLQESYMKHQQELAQAEAKATKKIFDKMGKIIEAIAKEKGLTMVLERTESALLYADPSLDLTKELIKRFNKK